ncbi:RNA polymerase sigma factor [Hyphomonas sp. NPDC076900]|uniref:RNA polymerase sigma factor n=1 Tax=unclassified Hyphomonas TaxID=2630699 RepID=UPI003D06AF4F
MHSDCISATSLANLLYFLHWCFFGLPGRPIVCRGAIFWILLAAMHTPSGEFVTWLARSVIPHEPALRSWLQKRARLDRIGLTADDIIQETYARLTRLASFEHIRDPRAYVFRTAYSVLLQEIRQNRVVSIESIESLEALDLVSQEPSPDRVLEMTQEMRILSLAINSMPKKCRIVFVLRKVHGYSQREISEQLGISENTVETHLARGVKKLMDFYQSSGIEPPAASDRLNSGEIRNGKRREARGHR